MLVISELLGGGKRHSGDSADDFNFSLLVVSVLALAFVLVLALALAFSFALILGLIPVSFLAVIRHRPRPLSIALLRAGGLLIGFAIVPRPLLPLPQTGLPGGALVRSGCT